MKLSDFDYRLPKELIAQHPLQKRDQARLLVVDRQARTFEDRIFSQITEYLRADDLLVINDSKVLPCRLKARRASGGKVELFLLEQVSPGVFRAMISPGRLRLDEKVFFDRSAVTATICGRDTVAFSVSDRRRIYALGSVPLPPYIKRPAVPQDRIDYQTVYARQAGSVASPTAGLHFTRPLLARIAGGGVHIGRVTLHVGLGTFKPVKCDDIRLHAMEREAYSIPEETRGLINRARENGSRIFAVGTTSCRVLETYATGAPQGSTGLFIYPGFHFKLVDCLLTNFHLPQTTLFMLACAFGTQDLIKRAYAHAIEKRYRFYSYGDAMLIV